MTCLPKENKSFAVLKFVYVHRRSKFLFSVNEDIVRFQPYCKYLICR